MPVPATPLAAYQAALAQAGFHADAAQWHAVQALQRCHQALADPRQARGVYLWGPVGRGKTWLLDLFHQSLAIPARRQHFHHFMLWVHRRLFQLSGTADPLTALARELAKQTRVLCFDELFVSDIGDAMLLGRLLQAMFAHGVVVLATSNQAPRQLYADGFNRQRFLPAIEAIERHMEIVAVDGPQDHRQHPGAPLQRYWVRQPESLCQAFLQLCAGESPSDQPIELAHRRINVLGHCPGVLYCRFDELCQQPLAPLDFVALCDRFSTILLADVPALGAPGQTGRIARGTEDAVERVAAGDRQLPQLGRNDDSVRRFIALVDECYDRRIPLYLDAEVELPALYTEGYLSFAFRRTLSRLQEMQLQRFAPLSRNPS